MKWIKCMDKHPDPNSENWILIFNQYREDTDFSKPWKKRIFVSSRKGYAECLGKHNMNCENTYWCEINEPKIKEKIC